MFRKLILFLFASGLITKAVQEGLRRSRMRREKARDREAVQRWEDEGGAPASNREAAS